MAQGDFFSNLNGMISKMDQLKKADIISLQQQENYLNKMLSYYDAINAKKKAGREWDLKTQTIWQNMKRFAKDMAEDAENLKNAKKDIKKADEEIKKLNEVEAKLLANGNQEAAKMVKKKKEQLNLEKEILKVNTEVAEGSVSGLGKAFNFLGKTGSVIKTNFGFIGSIFSGILGTAWNIGKALFDIVFPIEKAFKMFLEMQKVVGAISADIGLTQKEYFGLLRQMPTLYNDIIGYGGKIEDIATIIKGFSDTTGKNRIFSNNEVKSIIKLGYSTGLGVEGMTKMVSEFDNLGLSLSRTVKIAQKGREEAVKFNVNQTKVLQTTNEVVKSLAGTAFGRSVEDLTKLAAKAESLRFNLAESINSFKDAFFSPEKAVEAAAKIQVLGGEFAQMFGDPFSLMQESMTNADGMAEKMISAAKNLAVKNKNGMFEIPPAQRQILRDVLDALGQSERYPDIINAATEQAKVADKMNALAKSGKNLTAFSDDQRQQIANLMTLNKNGQYEISMGDGTKKLLTQLTGTDELKSILSQREVNDKAAQERLTLSEKFGIMLDRFAIGLTPLFTHLNELLENQGVMDKIQKFGELVGTTLINWSDKIFTNGGPLEKGIIGFLNKFTGFIDKLMGIVADPKSDFFTKVKEIFSEIANFVVTGLMPYVKITFAEIFKAMSGLPIIGDSLLSAALQLEENDPATKKIANGMGINNQKEIEKKISDVRKNTEYNTGGDVASHFGTGLLNTVGGAAEMLVGLIPAAFGNTDYLSAGTARTGIGLARMGDAAVAGFSSNMGVPTLQHGAGLERRIIDNAINETGASKPGWVKDVYDIEYLKKGGATSYAPAPQEAKPVKDAVAFANGKTLIGGEGDALAFIKENALGQAYRDNFGGSGTITVNVSGTMIHETDQGNVEITAQQLYASNPVLMGTFVNTVMEQHGLGSGNYKTHIAVTPL
jgi:hypothetical protein